MRREFGILVFTMLLLGGSTVPAAAETFNGFFAGIQGGYETNQDGATTWSLLESGPVAGAQQTSRGGDGVAYGFFLGYDLSLTERVFAGLELAYSLSTATFRYTDMDDTAPIEGQGAEASIKGVSSASLRLGVKLSEVLAVYGRGGITTTRIDVRSVHPDGHGFSLRSNEGGYNIGAGLQYALGNRFFSRLQYTYSDIDSGTSNPIDVSHRVMLGFGYGF